MHYYIDHMEWRTSTIYTSFHCARSKSGDYFPIVLSITDSSSPQQVAETSSFVTSGGTSCKLKFPVSDSVPLDSLPSSILTSANTFSFISSNTALTIASLPTENSLPVSTLSTSTSGSAHGATVTAHATSNQPSQTGDQSPGLSNSPSSRTSPAIFIGIIVGVTSLIVIAVIIFVLFRRRQRQRQFRQTVDLLADPQTPAMRTVYTDTLPQPDQSESLVHPQTSQDTPQLAAVIPNITVWTQTPENKGQHDIRTRPLPLSSPRKGNASNITQHPSASGQDGSITTIHYRDGDTSMTNLIVRREADAGVTLAGGRDIEEILPPAYGDF
ncbi:hypothetical protein C8Q75DRAFT_511249 [Abortiporus biennis]|nr:hypothetical protein C8Q75DRAFT_511249 [Abortiporus biennis]